jgi:hypothetical protein
MEMFELSSQKRAEIAWLLAKKDLANRGIPIGNALIREAGNLATKFKIGFKQVLIFYREMYVQLHNALFAGLQIQMEFSRDEAHTKKYLHAGGRAEVAVAYLIMQHTKNGNVHLNKGRVEKSIAEDVQWKSVNSTITADEIRMFYAELSANLHHAKVVTVIEEMMAKEKGWAPELLKG